MWKVLNFYIKFFLHIIYVIFNINARNINLEFPFNYKEPFVMKFSEMTTHYY